MRFAASVRGRRSSIPTMGQLITSSTGMKYAKRSAPTNFLTISDSVTIPIIRPFSATNTLSTLQIFISFAASTTEVPVSTETIFFSINCPTVIICFPPVILILYGSASLSTRHCAPVRGLLLMRKIDRLRKKSGESVTCLSSISVQLPIVSACVLLIILGTGTPMALAELAAEQVMIISNSNSRDSLLVAEHYAEQRGVPLRQIVKLDLPSDESMSRDAYEQRLVLPLRKALQTQNLHNSIRVL